jgi:hypothetical protein
VSKQIAVSLIVALLSPVACAWLFPRSPDNLPEFDPGPVTQILIFLSAPTVEETHVAIARLSAGGWLALVDPHDGTRLFVSHEAHTPQELPAVVQKIQRMASPVPLRFSTYLVLPPETGRAPPNKPLHLTAAGFSYASVRAPHGSW